MADFVKSRSDAWTMYLSLHSYGEKVLYPWSSTAEPVPDWRELRHVGKKMAEAIFDATGGRDAYKVRS